MRTILLIISYTGTHFSGWQKQLKNNAENARTVQGEIEKALAIIHKERIELFGSGRTDSGVHATGQAAHFLTPIETMPAKKFIPALNSILPQDIRIMNAQEVSARFHARFCASKRTYHYRLYCGSQLPAYESGRCWHIRHYPNIKKLNHMLLSFHGECDCTSFSAAGDSNESKSRYIYAAQFFYENDILIFEISANAFLWKMVRTIIGTLIELDKKDAPDDAFMKIVHAKDRNAAGMTAPPYGLFLHDIYYPNDILNP